MALRPFTVALAISATLASGYARAEEVRSPVQRRPDWVVTAVGAGIFAVGYGTALGVSFARSDEREAAWLRAPLVGPSIYFLRSEHATNDVQHVVRGALDLRLVISSTTLQLGGLVVLGVGLLYGKPVRPTANGVALAF